MMKLAFALVLLSSMLAAAWATSSEASFINGCIKLGITCRGIVAPTPPPGNPCPAAKLLFTTGCQATFYMLGAS